MGLFQIATFKKINARAATGGLGRGDGVYHGYECLALVLTAEAVCDCKCGRLLMSGWSPAEMVTCPIKGCRKAARMKPIEKNL